MFGWGQVMILTMDKEKGRVSLSTKKLEPTPGDMVRDPELVFARADEMAAAFRCASSSPKKIHLDHNLCGRSHLTGSVASWRAALFLRPENKVWSAIRWSGCCMSS